MTPVTIIEGVAVVIGVFVLALVIASPSTSKDRLEQRLYGVDEAMGGSSSLTLPGDEEMSLPFSERVITPLFNRIGNIMMRNSKAGQIEKLQRLIVQADVEGKSPQMLLGQQIILPIVFVGAALFLGSYFGFGLPITLAAVAGGVFFGRSLPVSSLKSKIKKRQKLISRALPGVMDLLTISMEAGLSMDMAMNRVAESEQSPLGKEFQKTLDEIRLGRPRLEALTAMSERNPVDELDNFIRAVVQAEPLGVSVANVLRVQSEELRRIRKQRAEEAGHRAPVLMLLPMLLCIFPCVFLVLLGPAIVKIMTGG